MIDVVFLSPPWGGPSYLQGSSRPASPVKGSSVPGMCSVHSDNKRTDVLCAVLPADADEITPTEHPTYSLASIRPLPGDELFHLTRRISHNVAYYLPRNTDLAEIGALVKVADGGAPKTTKGKGKATAEQGEKIEIEEEWMGNKLKALTCYFGGLASGQEDMFDK